MRSVRLLISLFLILASSSLYAGSYGINSSDGKDTVYFRSSAKLEFIEGKTNDISGSFSVDPTNLGTQITGALRVDLRTLKTGIDMRDEHMRTRHLETDKFPYAYFELTGTRGLPAQLAAGATDTGIVEGWFYIHGVKRKLEAPVQISRLTEASGKDAITVRARFSINLDDYKIPRPKALLLKLAETVNVECIFSGYNDLGGTTFELPGWAELK